MVRGAGITEWPLARGRSLLSTGSPAGRWRHVCCGLLSRCAGPPPGCRGSCLRAVRACRVHPPSVRDGSLCLCAQCPTVDGSTRCTKGASSVGQGPRPRDTSHSSCIGQFVVPKGRGARGMQMDLLRRGQGGGGVDACSSRRALRTTDAAPGEGRARLAPALQSSKGAVFFGRAVPVAWRL